MHDLRRARINYKLLVGLILVAAGGCVALTAGYYARKNAIASRALAAGAAAYDAREWPEAARQLKKYLSSYPDDEVVLSKYARAQLLTRPSTADTMNSAAAAYRRLLRTHRGDRHLCNALAGLYSALGDTIETSYVARQRLASDPADPQATLWLARAQIAQHKYDEARELLTGYLDHRSNAQPEMYAVLSALTLEEDAQNVDRALKWLDTAVANNPRSPEVFASRARFYRQRKRDLARARQDLETADELQPATEPVRIALTEEWLEIGNLERAAAELDAAGRLPRDPDADLDPQQQDRDLRRFQLAGEIALRGDDKAKAAQLAAEPLGRQLAGIRLVNYLWYAVKLDLLAGNMDAAHAALEQYRLAVADFAAKDALAAERLALLNGAVANYAGKYYEAMNYLEPLVALGEVRDPAAYRQLAYAYQQTGQDRRAILALEKYVTLRPEDAPATLDMIALCYRSGDWGNLQRFVAASEQRGVAGMVVRRVQLEAAARGILATPPAAVLAGIREEAANLRKANPKDLQVRLVQAYLASLEGKPDDAIRELRAAIAECDAPLPAVYQLLEVLRGQSKHAEAIEVCRTAIARFPAETPLQLTLADLQTLAGDKLAARVTLEKAATNAPPPQRLSARLAMARFLLDNRDRPAGLEHLQQLRDDRPDAVEPRLILLNQPELQADARQTETLVDEIRRIEGDRGVRWRYEQARMMLRDNSWKAKTEQILALLQPCVEADPGWTSPVLAIGRVFENIGREGRAEEVYRAFLQSNPGNVAVTTRLLELLEKQNRYAAATRVLEGMPEVSPVVGRYRAQLALARKDYDAASRDLDAQVRSDPRDASARVLLASVIYQQKHDLPAALKLLDEARLLAPEMLGVTATRATILTAAGKRDEAIAALNAEVDARNDFQAFLLRADYYASQGRLAEAEKDYRQLASFPTRAVEGCLRLGRFYEDHHRPADALAAYEATLKLEPGSPDLRLAQVRLLVASRDPALHARGVDGLSEMLRRSPDDPDLLFIQAGELLAEGRPQSTRAGLELLEKVVARDPRNIPAHVMLIKNTADRGELAEAAKLATRALGASPENTDLLLVRAGLETDLGNDTAARELAQSVLTSDPPNVPARVLLVKLALRAGQINSAEGFVREALQLEPDRDEARLAEASVLEAKKQPQRAIEVLEAFRQTAAGDARVGADVALARLYLHARDYPRCEERLADAETLAPDRFDLYLARLEALAGQNRFDEAAGRISARLERYPGDARTLMASASLLSGAGQGRDLEAARRIYEELVKNAPQNVAAQFGLATLAYSAGDAQAAANAYRKVLELEPYQRAALNNLAWILSETLAQPKEALDYATRGLARYPDDPNLLNTRGTILLRLKQPAAARQDLEKCLGAPRVTPATYARTLEALTDIARLRGEPASQAAGD
jgi:tetratricopeptide (TPR) repeat protein